MSILIVDNYDSFTFNLYQMIQVQTDKKVVVKRNDAISLEEVSAMAPSAIVLSPGPGHPRNKADFGVCADVVKHAAILKCPILGVCLGHQGIAHHLGGVVERAPQILHGKTSTIDVVSETPLFEGIPRNFKAMRYHSLVVSKEKLPSCLKVVASERNGNLIMALQHAELPMFGVQFHPESIGTPEGKVILRNFLSLC